MGGQGDPGRAAIELVAATRAGYDSAAGGWDDGPGRLYRDLAAALVTTAGPMTGQRVLDLGAGTGAAGRAALAAGAAQVAAADLAPSMLARCPPGLRPVAADAAALPFRDRAFDLVLAAFCLGHLPDVGGSLAEARRVGARLAVSSFAPGWTHPAKGAVDRVLAEFGYRPPDWYLAFKRETEPRSQDPDWLRGQLAAARFGAVEVRTLSVRTSLATAAQLAAWRLGMAHVAPFVAALPAARRAELNRAAEAAAGAGSLTVSVLILTAA